MPEPILARSDRSGNFVSQSTPEHIAIIMDGNRRWAKARNLPVSDGHKAGMQRLIDLLPSLAHCAVRTVTVFAFSSANWRRQRTEVEHLFRLTDLALRRFTPLCLENDIRVSVIGRRDRLPPTLLRAAEKTARLTERGQRELRIALDYSSRHSILEAAKCLSEGADADDFESLLGGDSDAAGRATGPVPRVDLLIRTGKEQRLSDFLLWESAFAELYFPDLYWPDFTTAELRKAIAWYQQRQRRFGA